MSGTTRTRHETITALAQFLWSESGLESLAVDKWGFPLRVWRGSSMEPPEPVRLAAEAVLDNFERVSAIVHEAVNSK